jgi:glycosyltransferase involved in cell wall biosynthesis
VFPNRCEGGTNLVAMEAMACGVPAFVAYNTGQKDIVDLMGAEALRSQKAVKPSPEMNSVEDWGETDVEELVAALERTYTQHTAAKQKAAQVAEGMKQWEWGPMNEKLLQIVCDQKAEAA